MISFLIVIHELGHVFMAIIQKIKVKSIYLYPLGGVTKLDMPLNTSPLKELLILLNGPLFQCIAYLILLNILPNQEELITLYHTNILHFNLLPIYPLDGGKILKLFLELFLPYQTSLQRTIQISYLTTIILLICSPVKKINTIIMIIFLVSLIKKEEKKVKITYQKFLLERVNNHYNFRKGKIIFNSKNFYRNKKHIIKEGEKYYLEKEYLEKKYHKIWKNY